MFFLLVIFDLLIGKELRIFWDVFSHLDLHHLIHFSRLALIEVMKQFLQSFLAVGLLQQQPSIALVLLQFGVASEEELSPIL